MNGSDAHPLAGRRHRPGADRQQHVRRAEPRHRVGEDVEMLLGGEAAGVDEHARVGGEAERGAPARRCARSGWNAAVSTPSGCRATRSTPQSSR